MPCRLSRSSTGELTLCNPNPNPNPNPSLRDLAHARPQLTDASLLALAALPALRSLDLSGCVAATERGFGSLAARARLTTLRLGGCSRVATVQVQLHAVWAFHRVLRASAILL